MTPGLGAQGAEPPRNPPSAAHLEVRVRLHDFPKQGWLTPAGPSHCQSQHSSSEAARKGVGEPSRSCFSKSSSRSNRRTAQAKPARKDEELEAGRLRHLRPRLREDTERGVTTGIGQLQTIPGPEWAPRLGLSPRFLLAGAS